ncbi:hypothetical protein [Natrinema versiforme]|uniref:hypothetical protein n=1 Tax=Natrinema versiforme TaxID=88724 RepID=UPI001268E3EC|nr:hypothetical protein [Natrinema versiforme]
MTDESFVEDQYTYDGWLVFNELFNTEVVSDGVTIEDVIGSFPLYEGGSPNDPDAGFERTNLPSMFQNLSEIGTDFQDFANSIRSFKYVDEDWVEEWGYDENANEQIFYKDYHDEVDIFWDSDSQIMMFRGDKQLLGRKRESLQAGLSGSLYLDPVNFNFDFFLWVLYKKYNKEDLSSDLRVRKLTRGKTIGEHEDNLGKRVRVEGSENILRSLMLIAPVLAGKKIQAIQGSFLMGKHKVNAEIEHGGKVHIKVSDSPLSGLSHLRRMGIALQFLTELIRLYNVWEGLPSNDRYPPPSFFDDLSNVAEEEGWDHQYDPENIKEEYRGKRED